MHGKKDEKAEKAEKALNKVEDDLVLCMIIEDDTKQVQKKKRVSFANNIKFKIQQAALLYTA